MRTRVPLTLLACAAYALTSDPAAFADEPARTEAFRKVLGQAPELSYPEVKTAPVGEPTPQLVATAEGAHVERAQKMLSTRRVDQAIALADIPGLHVGQLIDAGQFQKDGVHAPLPAVPRADQTLVVEATWAVAGGKQAKVDQVAPADVAGFYNGTNIIIGRRFGTEPVAFPDKIDYRFEEASSVHEMSKQLNVTAKGSGFGVSVAGGFTNYRAKNSTNKMVYLYARQEFFRVTRKPVPVGEVFGAAVAPERLAREFGPKRVGVVNSVSYGRVVFAAFKSDYDSEKVREALNLRVDSKWGDASTTTVIKNKALTILRQTTMRCVIHGGTVPGDLRLFETSADKGVVAMVEYLNAGVKFGPENLGAVIGYTVADLVSGEPVGVVDANEYTAFEGTRQPYRFTLKLREALIVDDCDTGFAGAGDWVVLVRANGDLVQKSQSELDTRPAKPYPLNVTTNPNPATSARELKLEFFIGEQDDEGFIVSPEKMREGGTGANKNGPIDDFTEQAENLNLGELTAAATTIAKDGKVTIKPIRKEIVVTTERGNVFTFDFELQAPPVPAP